MPDTGIGGRIMHHEGAGNVCPSEDVADADYLSADGERGRDRHGHRNGGERSGAPDRLSMAQHGFIVVDPEATCLSVTRICVRPSDETSVSAAMGSPISATAVTLAFASQRRQVHDERGVPLSLGMPASLRSDSHSEPAARNRSTPVVIVLTSRPHLEWSTDAEAPTAWLYNSRAA